MNGGATTSETVAISRSDTIIACKIKRMKSK